jgi:hypothetical protein
MKVDVWVKLRASAGDTGPAEREEATTMAVQLVLRALVRAPDPVQVTTSTG